MDCLTVQLGERSYPIYTGQEMFNVLSRVLGLLHVRGTVAIVTDTNVGPLYADQVAEVVRGTGVRVCVSTLPAGEEHKRLSNIEALCGDFLQAGLDRSSVVVALGGGVVGDMAGFAASTFMRGIRHIQVPTTIVAQVDSSVGGKTGVNHPLGKNTIGAFHQPSGVVIDMTFLKTLPDRELRAGLAEVIKHGVIADENLFGHMETFAEALLACDLDALLLPVMRSCEIKAAIVAADEREEGVRANLNYGHTFGHGIEAVTRYETFLHGEAVALGMHAAACLARDLGLIGQDLVDRQRACLAACGLPTCWPELPIEETLIAMRRDKKAREGTMKFVLPDRLGHVVHRTDITEEQVRRALDALRADG